MVPDELLRQETLWLIRHMGQLVVPAQLYERARQLLPEVADKIIKSEMLPLLR